MSLNPNIASPLATALEKKGYTSLTEVQEEVLASAADGADLLVSAQTGSGKTVAFGMAIAPNLLGEADVFPRPDLPQALVVAPTRELALQVQRELDWLFATAQGQIASCVGGMDPRAERRALQRGCHIVVGTPGRLRDHIERGALDMSDLKAVVLDEADEMLDFGFREDLEFILDAAPASRRTLMFSATVPRSIAALAKRYQRDALRISTVGEQKQHGDIEYKAMAVAPRDVENAIINILRYYDAQSTIIFCATREAVNRLSSRFGNRGFSVVALSGELSQRDRTMALQAMRDGRARVCVATDVAARGIDLPNLELVIHADLPTNGEILLHRSGRTGRAGRKGVCVLVVPQSRRSRGSRLLRDAKVEAEWSPAPSLEDIKVRDKERILDNPALSAEYDEADMAFAAELLERHGPEKVAAAFLSRCQTEMPAAEELADASAYQSRPEKRDGRNRRDESGGRDRGERRDRGDRSEGPKPRRDDFGEGVWFTLTAGRKERAEPRWLLPLICRLGNVTKTDVGSIKIGETVSRFQINAKAADQFMEEVKRAGGGEKSIRINRDTGEAKHSDEARSAKAKPKSRPTSSKSVTYKAKPSRPPRNMADEPSRYRDGSHDGGRPGKKPYQRKDSPEQDRDGPKDEWQGKKSRRVQDRPERSERPNAVKEERRDEGSTPSQGPGVEEDFSKKSLRDPTKSPRKNKGKKKGGKFVPMRHQRKGFGADDDGNSQGKPKGKPRKKTLTMPGKTGGGNQPPKRVKKKKSQKAD